MKIVNLTLEVLLLDIFIAAPTVEEDKFWNSGKMYEHDKYQLE